MPIYINKKQIGTVQIHKAPMSYVFVGPTIVWQSIRSCFGKGYWINEKPWINVDGWKNN